MPEQKDLVDLIREATFLARRPRHRELLDTQTVPDFFGTELQRLQRSFQIARGPKKRRKTALSFERAVQRRALYHSHPSQVPETVWRRIRQRVETAAKQGRGLTLDAATIRVLHGKLPRPRTRHSL